MTAIDRRRFLAQVGVASAATGAAWAAPSVLGATTAFAAGSPGTCPSDVDLAFVAGAGNGPSGWPTGNGNGMSTNPVSNNGWAISQTSMTGTDALGVFATFHAPPPTVPHFVVERNPAANNIAGAQVSYTHSLGTLSASTNYPISSQTYSVNTNQYTQLLAVQVLGANGALVTNLGRFRTDASTAANNANYTLMTPDTWTPRSWLFTPPADGTYQFRFLFTFTAAGAGANTGGNNGVGDDIAVTAPTMTCA